MQEFSTLYVGLDVHKETLGSPCSRAPYASSDFAVSVARPRPQYCRSKAYLISASVWPSG
jgi:hypothetical protein